jgi:beta-xylosidase
MKAYFLAAVLALGSLASQAQQLPKRSGNPLFPGWYADPEVAIFGSQYWIYPTYSAPYEQQVFFDAFSSTDLVTWTKHARILDTARVKWAHRALWAPAIVAKNGRYYLFFGANDYHPEKPNEPPGGIGVAVADHPAGPFKDYLGHPLVGTIENGAQPIDQFVFKDADGQYYLLYGGWQHCNIARLKDDFTGFLPFADGTVFKSITPQNYVEGPLMFRRQGKYYFMWSEGGWTGPDYSVAYAVGDSPFGPFRRVGKILAQDPKVGTGAGHHSVVQVPGTDRWYIVYHRHPLGDPDGNHRVVCIEELHFGKDGLIQPVKLTTQGVAAQPLKP